MPTRKVAETGEELLAQLEAEADRVITPAEIKERRRRYVLDKLSMADRIIPIRGAPTARVREEALALVERSRV